MRKEDTGPLFLCAAFISDGAIISGGAIAFNTSRKPVAQMTVDLLW
ncbi:MAG: hypothetical protein ACFB16_07165 [Phormidesmis sp.]